MVEFPREMNVSVPAGTVVPGAARVAVRLDGTSLPVAPLLEAIGNRLVWVEARVEDLDGDGLAAVAGQRLRVRASAADLARVGEHVDEFHAANTVFLVKADATLSRTVNFLTALRFAVHVDAASEPAAVHEPERVCHAYLHSSTLRVPIEPFHSLLLTVAGRGEVSLWQTEFEDTQLNGYVTETGTVTLSARWSERGKNYGSLDQDWPGLKASSVYKELSTFREGLFRGKSPCVLCPHLNLCEGFLRAVDRTAPCDPWKRAFDLLRAESNHARQILESADGVLT